MRDYLVGLHCVHTYSQGRLLVTTGRLPSTRAILSQPLSAASIPFQPGNPPVLGDDAIIEAPSLRARYAAQVRVWRLRGHSELASATKLLHSCQNNAPIA